MWIFTPIVQLCLLHLVLLTIASLWPGSGRPRRLKCRCRPLADGRHTRLLSEISTGPLPECVAHWHTGLKALT
jgi:hypothetical protein